MPYYAAFRFRRWPTRTSRLESHDRVTFSELLETELTAIYGGETAGKVILSGPPGIRLRSSAVQILAMALHELATNALKYGALHQAGARLEISWTFEAGANDDYSDDEPWLRIDWRESGVRMHAEDERSWGQGRELIEQLCLINSAPALLMNLGQMACIAQFGFRSRRQKKR
jgi:two-component sensor histidine kinase